MFVCSLIAPFWFDSKRSASLLLLTPEIGHPGGYTKKVPYSWTKFVSTVTPSVWGKLYYHGRHGRDRRHRSDDANASKPQLNLHRHKNKPQTIYSFHWWTATPAPHARILNSETSQNQGVCAWCFPDMKTKSQFSASFKKTDQSDFQSYKLHRNSTSN